MKELVVDMFYVFKELHKWSKLPFKATLDQDKIGFSDFLKFQPWLHYQIDV